ncbi:MAG TPA: hypothetical protein VFZ93_08250 [Albitalea sp.]
MPPVPTAPIDVRHSIAGILSAGLLGAIACVTLSGCDAAADVAAAKPAGVMRAAPSRAPAAVATVPDGAPAAMSGNAALQEHRPDLDPSHAAIASYRD